MAHLLEEGIGTRKMYPPINRQRCYGTPGNFEVTEAVGEYGLWLPSMIQISDDEIERICLAIRSFYSGIGNPAVG